MDLLAEKTLTALFKRGRCSTTELNRMTGGKPRLIKHRIDEWLAPAGLVKQCGTRPHSVMTFRCLSSQPRGSGT